MAKEDKALRTASLDEVRLKYIAQDESEAVTDPESPARWWFFTSLFPLIGATFGPVASAFSLCALAGHWRVIVSPTSSEAEGHIIADPTWLYAINAVSLFIAVFANLSLIAHMAGRISFHVAHPIVTSGWFIASFLLIGLVAAAPRHLNHQPFTFSQAYYYACFAAALYFILAVLMLLVFHGVYVGKYTREYKLTMAQRSLMMQTVAFLAYLLSAAAVYARIENWDYLDAVYWCDVTLFTIGFGDFSPKTHLGRSLIFPMAVGGIIFVGLIVASIKALMLDSGTQKVSRRNIEKARQKLLSSKNRLPPTTNDTTELIRREAEFNLMRRAQANAKLINATTALLFSALVWLALWFIGAIIFWRAEHSTGGQDWSYFVALYFTYISFLTIGYGDFYPQTNSAKPAFVFWSLLALPALTVLVGALADVITTGWSAGTVWLADHLPEKTAALRDLKQLAHKTKKREGGSHSDAKPPGFMSSQQHEPHHFDDEEHSAAVRGLSGDNLDEHHVAAAKHYRPYLIMKAIKNVVAHLDASPPRKYTFAEWAWFMKLLGEDEEDPTLHRSPEDEAAAQRAKLGLAKGEERAPALEKAEQKGREGQAGEPGEGSPVVQPFSWVGPSSPLMSTQEEPQWILGKLIDALELELKGLGNAKMNQLT